MTYNVVYRDGTTEVMEDRFGGGFSGIARDVMAKYYPNNFYAEEVQDYSVSNFAISGWQDVKYFAIFEKQPVNYQAQACY